MTIATAAAAATQIFWRPEKPVVDGRTGSRDGAACEGLPAGRLRDAPLLPDFRRLRTNAIAP